jgi:diketogulonate reductase-like aldo/keto reductase
VLEAFSPLASGAFNLLADPVITSIAERVGRTPGQVVLRWHVQQGRVVLPKSNNEGRMAENRSLFDFELNSDEIASINGLHPVGVAARRVCPDPNTIV